LVGNIPGNLAVDAALCQVINGYRANYLVFFLRRFEDECPPGHKGGWFNISSVTGRPYDHRCCYSWTDGRSLGELSVSHLAGLAAPDRLERYATHLRDVLLERHALNGYFPHVVGDETNLAEDHPMNVYLGAGESSFSHVFVLNGLLQYGLVFGDGQALALGRHLLEELEQALQEDRFLEGAAPRPSGQRAQGPFMISLGAIADVLETLARKLGRDSEAFPRDAEPLVSLGKRCLSYILGAHHRAEDHAFWEVSQNGEALRNDQGQAVTDPGHTIEFTGFAARFAAFLEPEQRDEVLRTCRAILLWAARSGFHPTRDLIYKNVDRDTGTPIRNEMVPDISRVVSREVFARHFGGTSQPVSIATFPWWVPMELLAAASILRHGDGSGEVDAFALRAVRGIFEYYRNERIDGLCYQNIGDGFFEYIDVPPATATLDLMHSHRSMRVFLREVGV